MARCVPGVLWVGGRRTYLGSFDTAVEAAVAYARAVGEAAESAAAAARPTVARAAVVRPIPAAGPQREAPRRSRKRPCGGGGIGEPWAWDEKAERRSGRKTLMPVLGERLSVVIPVELASGDVADKQFRGVVDAVRPDLGLFWIQYEDEDRHSHSLAEYPAMRKSRAAGSVDRFASNSGTAGAASNSDGPTGEEPAAKLLQSLAEYLEARGGSREMVRDWSAKMHDRKSGRGSYPSFLSPQGTRFYSRAEVARFFALDTASIPGAIPAKKVVAAVPDEEANARGPKRQCRGGPSSGTADAAAAAAASADSAAAAPAKARASDEVGPAQVSAEGLRLHLSNSSSSGYKSVTKRGSDRFEAWHSVDGRKVLLGAFGTAVEAAVAYARAVGEAAAGAEQPAARPLASASAARLLSSASAPGPAPPSAATIIGDRSSVVSAAVAGHAQPALGVVPAVSDALSSQRSVRERLLQLLAFGVRVY